MHIVFETPRLILRRFTEEDAPLIYRLTSDPEVLHYVHEPTLENEAQAKDILTNIILPQYKLNLGRWAIHTKPDQQFIGWCGLKYIEKTGIIDLGYRLLKMAWGKGYATESAYACLKYGFEKLGLARIVGRALPGNAASLRVLEKCGMTYLGEEVVEGLLHKSYELRNPLIP